MYESILIEKLIKDTDVDLITKCLDKFSFSAVGNNHQLSTIDLFSIQNLEQNLWARILKESQLQLEKTIEQKYNLKITNGAGPSITRYLVGQMIGVHRDWEPEDSYVILNKKKKVDLASIIYINDNYSGGELVFYSDSSGEKPYLTLKPNAGSCVLFDSGIYHSTLPVKSGVKYCQTMFYSL